MTSNFDFKKGEIMMITTWEGKQKICPSINNSRYLNVAADAIGPGTDFTLETDEKMCTKNK